MKDTTRNLIRQILAADETATIAEQDAVTDALAGPDRTGATMTRAEAAQFLGRSPATVDRLARTGKLPRILVEGFDRSPGFKAADVRRLRGVA